MDKHFRCNQWPIWFVMTAPIGKASTLVINDHHRICLFFCMCQHSYCIVQPDKASAGDSRAALPNELVNRGRSSFKTSPHVQTNWLLRLTIGSLFTLVYIQPIITCQDFQQAGSWKLWLCRRPSQFLRPTESYKSLEHIRSIWSAFFKIKHFRIKYKCTYIRFVSVLYQGVCVCMCVFCVTNTWKGGCSVCWGAVNLVVQGWAASPPHRWKYKLR